MEIDRLKELDQRERVEVIFSDLSLRTMFSSFDVYVSPSRKRNVTSGLKIVR